MAHTLMQEAIHAQIQCDSSVALNPGNNGWMLRGTYPQVQGEALLDFPLEAVCLYQAIAV